MSCTRGCPSRFAGFSAMEDELPSTIASSKCAEMLLKRATARVGTVVRRCVGVIAVLLVAVTLMAAPARADFEHGQAAYEVGDYAKAVAEWLPAATRGDFRAQTYLGVMYERGLGVARDDAEAVRWYRLAADQGNAGAQFTLGGMYANGRGVPQDDVQAHMWYNLAASRLTSEQREIAVQGRDIIAARMTPEDRSDAQRLAREWDADRKSVV